MKNIRNAVSGEAKYLSVLECSLIWPIANMYKIYKDKQEAAVSHNLL